MKVCSKCGLEKHESSFGHTRYNKSGLKAQCKACAVLYQQGPASRQRAKLYRESERGRIKARTRNNKYKKIHRDQMTDYQKQYRQSDIGLRGVIKYRQSDKHKTAVAKYYRSPKGKLLQIRRREAERAIDTVLSSQDIAKLYELFKAKCFNCGSTERLCIDHCKPLSKGFGLSLQNATLLCKSCNSSKHNKMPEEFYSEEKLNILSKLLAE
jgi:5-methylcytosine-specific restriction endonuclease McrA